MIKLSIKAVKPEPGSAQGTAIWSTPCSLHSMRGTLLSKLAAVAGDLAPRRLGFLETPVANPASGDLPALPMATVEKVEAKATPVPSAVHEAAAAISDSDLRERFLESALRYLARSRPS